MPNSLLMISYLSYWTILLKYVDFQTNIFWEKKEVAGKMESWSLILFFVIGSTSFLSFTMWVCWNTCKEKIIQISASGLANKHNMTCFTLLFPCRYISDISLLDFHQPTIDKIYASQKMFTVTHSVCCIYFSDKNCSSFFSLQIKHFTQSGQ